MELSGTANWVALGTGTVLAKTDTSPYAGAKSLQVTTDAGSKGVYSTCTQITGCRYDTRFAIRTSGITVVAYGAGSAAPSSHSNTSWGLSSVEKTADGGPNRPWWNANSAGQFWLDSVTHTNLSLSSMPFDIGSGALAQANPTNMPWDKAVGGVRAIAFGTLVGDNKILDFSSPIPVVSGRTRYFVVNKLANSGYWQCLFRGSSSSVYLESVGNSGKIGVYNAGGVRAVTPCSTGIRLIRFRHGASDFGLKVDNGDEVPYSGSITGDWLGFSEGSGFSMASDLLAYVDIPTPSDAVDYSIRRLLAAVTGAVAPTA
jgi:hypothetical protein